MPQAQHPTIHKGNFIALFYSFQYHKSSRLIATRQEREKDKEMFIALETLALPSQLLNDPPFGVSPSTGGRIKHVLNVDTTVAADKPMRSGDGSRQGLEGGGPDMLLKATAAHNTQCKFHVASEPDNKCTEGYLSWN